MGKFRMLRTVSLIMRVLAWVSLLGSIALAVLTLTSPGLLAQYGLGVGYASAWLSFLAMLIGGIVYAILLFAAGEAITVSLSIEDNTRRLRELLDKK